MIVCPYCDAQNIEGADTCEKCQQPLAEFSAHVPGTSVERDLLRDRIERLWPKPPLAVPSSMPVGEVLAKMIDKVVGCAMIMENEKLLGIFTERDALMKLNVDASSLADQPVSDFMTSDPDTLEAEDKIAYALHKMNLGGYRHIPILFSGKLVGMISVRDILLYLGERIASAAKRA